MRFKVFGRYCFGCEGPDVTRESFCCHCQALCHLWENNKQPSAGRMSGPGECAEQNKPTSRHAFLKIMTCSFSLTVFTIVLTLLKRARIPAAKTHTHGHTHKLPPSLHSFPDNGKSQGSVWCKFGADQCKLDVL